MFPAKGPVIMSDRVTTFFTGDWLFANVTVVLHGL
jgi:hypothetical protein